MKWWFNKLAVAEKLVIAMIIIASFDLSTNLSSTASPQVDSTGWSSPQEIVDVGSMDAHEGQSIAVELNGDWHVVYNTNYYPGGNLKTSYIKHVSSTSAPYIIDQATMDLTYPYTGAKVEFPSIATDANGGLHVVYRYLNYEEGHSSIKYTTKAGRGAVLIHGFNGRNDSWGGPDAPNDPNLKSLLEEDGRLVKYFSYPSSSPSDWDVPISTLASYLDNSLTAWNDGLHIDERGVDIIAHCMGALIARYYIAHPDGFSFASKVKKLIILATPNYGAAAALWGDLVPGTIQATQMKFGSLFLWDLHEEWNGASFETDVLCIAGAKDNYSDPHDGVILLPSANLENLGYPVCYIPNKHGGVGGMAYIEDVNHPSYVAINSFLSGETPQSNEENVSHLTEGMLIVGLFDPSGNRVDVRTIYVPLLGHLPRVWWDPNPTLYWRWLWWPWLSSFGSGVNPSSGKYYATGADAGSYKITITPTGGYSTITIDPVTIEPRQTKVLSLTVFPADESATETFAGGDTPPVTFGNTDVTMDFSSGPGGDVSVYRFDDDPPATDCATLPHYWDIVSDMPNDSFSVSVAFSYVESEVLSAGQSEEELIIAYYDSLWHPMVTIVDTVANKVSVTTTHFTLFSIGNFPGTGIEEEPEFATLPSCFALSQNYPNPFNLSTTIKYQLKGKSSSTKSLMPTTLNIYNVQGQLVRTLVNGEKLPGNYSVIWDGKDQYGKEVASGIYLYRLQAGEYDEVRKMILMK